MKTKGKDNMSFEVSPQLKRDVERMAKLSQMSRSEYIRGTLSKAIQDGLIIRTAVHYDMSPQGKAHETPLAKIAHGAE